MKPQKKNFPFGQRVPQISKLGPGEVRAAHYKPKFIKKGNRLLNPRVDQNGHFFAIRPVKSAEKPFPPGARLGGMEEGVGPPEKALGPPEPKKISIPFLRKRQVKLEGKIG